jgi:hypothetical protein
MLERQQAAAWTPGIGAHAPIHAKTASQRQEMPAPARTIRAIMFAPTERLEIARQLFNNVQEMFVQAGPVAGFSFHGSTMFSLLSAAADAA